MEIDLAALWRAKATLVIGTIVGVVAGVAYLMMVPPTYQAQARVLVEPRGVRPEMELNERIDPEFLPTQAETIRSPITINRALGSVTVTPPPGVDLAEFDPVRSVLESLDVTPILKANVLTVGYRSTYPDEALQVLSSIVEAYRYHVSELDKSNSDASMEVVAARERKLRAELEEAQEQYNELCRSSPLLLGHGREASAQAVIQLNHLGSQLAETRRRRAELEFMLASLTDSPVSQDQERLATARTEAAASGNPERVVALKPEIAEEPSDAIAEILRFAEPEDARAVQEVEERLRFAKLLAVQLDETYGPLYPDLVAARADVAELEALKQQRLDQIAQAWRRHLNMTDAAERELKESYQAEQARVKEAETYLIREQFLQGNLARIEELHAATLAQVVQMQSAEAAIAGGRTSITVRILDGPALLDEMTWPKPKLLIAVSACLGLAAAGFLVLFRESQKRTIRSQGLYINGNATLHDRHERNHSHLDMVNVNQATGAGT